MWVDEGAGMRRDGEGEAGGEAVGNKKRQGGGDTWVIYHNNIS